MKMNPYYQWQNLFTFQRRIHVDYTDIAGHSSTVSLQSEYNGIFQPMYNTRTQKYLANG